MVTNYQVQPVLNQLLNRFVFMKRKYIISRVVAIKLSFIWSNKYSFS